MTVQDQLNELGFYTLAGGAQDPAELLGEVPAAEDLGLGSAFISERFNVKEAATLCGAVAAASALDGGAVALGLQPPFVGAPAGTGRDARALRRGDRVPEQGGEPGSGPLAVGELAALLGGGHREHASG